ncbi:MFS transporter [Amycolatopsis jejuensis]|uniref:MFS transporter n=1 Tax=Amycolatopsis jejuensis TaxID=330084 RepID=UPI0007C50ADF|nr:MFS transporter [Amycolatopsis jejuensis]
MTSSGNDPNRRELRRVLLASYLGSAVEYYDFLLYVTASSLVFNKLFFSNLSPVAGTIASLATLAVGYVSRPLGAVLFGHFGDRLGRKSVLVVSLLMMGASTTLIGVLPTSQQVGALAPVLLVLLRVLQGISVGGEWGGASLMAFEHAPPHRRGFAASFSAAGGPTGTALAAGVLGLFTLMPRDQFFSWGWRLPFLLSAVLVGIGLWTRLRISESPLFVAEKRRQQESGETPKIPLWEVLRSPRPLILAFLALLASFTFNSLVGSFSLTYSRDHGLDVSVVLGIQVVGGIVCVAGEILGGAASDRFGRRAVLAFGVIVGSLFAYPFLQLISSGETGKTMLAFVVMYGFAVGPLFGPTGAYLSEQFATRSRYTGASLGYQSASTVGGGFVPVILASLLAASNGGHGLILLFLVGIGVLSLLALAAGKRVPQPVLVTDDVNA